MPDDKGEVKGVSMVFPDFSKVESAEGVEEENREVIVVNGTKYIKEDSVKPLVSGGGSGNKSSSTVTPI